MESIKQNLQKIPYLQNEYRTKIAQFRKENERLKFENAYFEKLTDDVIKKLEDSEKKAENILDCQENMKENFFKNEEAAKEIEEKLEKIQNPEFKELLEQQLTIVKTT